MMSAPAILPSTATNTAIARRVRHALELDAAWRRAACGNHRGGERDPVTRDSTLDSFAAMLVDLGG
jgi:hypothetical protein